MRFVLEIEAPKALHDLSMVNITALSNYLDYRHI